MSLTITHPFVSAIADDPVAAAAGQVVPSNWNAAHSISGILPVANLPLATSSTPGIVQPDNSTITISSGTLSAVPAGITIGTTAITGGASTEVLYNLGGVVSSDAGLVYTGAAGFLNTTATVTAPLFIGTQNVAGQAQILQLNNTAASTTAQAALQFNTTATLPGVLFFTSATYASGYDSSFGFWNYNTGGSASIIFGLNVAEAARFTWYQSLNLGPNVLTWGSLPNEFSEDVFLRRGGPANLVIGGFTDSATPVAQTLSFQNGLGTNISSVNTTINGSLGTGTGTNGDIIFQTGRKTTTGTAQATPTTALTIKGETQQIVGGVGTASAPTYSFAGVLNQGMWSVASGNISFSLAGSEQVRFSNGNGIETPYQLIFGGSLAVPFSNLYSGSSGVVTLSTGLSTSGNGSLILANMASSGTYVDTGYDYQTPTTGSTVTLSSTKWHTIIDPAGALLALTVKTPASPADGQLLDFKVSQAITTLTVSPNSGQSVVGGPAAGASVAGITYNAIYRSANTTWYF